MTKTTDNKERFASRKKALDWLVSQGHKISTGKFYQDCKKGFPAIADDGSVSKYQVLSYGVALNKKIEPDHDALSSREYDQRKAKADAEMAEMKAKRMDREQDRLWLHADDAWSAMAGIIGNLRDAVRHQLYMSQREAVEIAGGDQDRAQELFEFCDGLIDKAFNEAAGDDVDVVFEREVE